MKRSSFFVSLLTLLALAAPASAQTWTSLGPATGEVPQVFVAPSQPSTLLALAGGDNGGVFKTTNSGVSWQSISAGLCDLHVNAVAFHLTDPNTIYVGTLNGGVCGTTNGGTTWTQLKTGLPVDANGFPTRVNAVAINPLTPARLLAGTVNGVYRSTDSGATWAAAGMPGAEVSSIVVSPSTPATSVRRRRRCRLQKHEQRCDLERREYRAAGQLLRGPALSRSGECERGLFFNRHDLQDLERRHLLGAVRYRTGTPFFIGDVLVDPVDGNTLYASAVGGCGVCKSTNGGASWSPAGATGLPTVFGISNVAIGMAIDPTAPTHLFAGSPEGVFSSTDSGVTWTSINANLSTLAISALELTSSSPASVILAYSTTADAASLTRLNGGVTPFSPLTSPLVADDSGGIVSIVVDPTDGGIIYVLGGKQSGQRCPTLYKTINGGSAWTEPLTNAATSGITTGTCLGSMTMDPATSTTLYLAVTYGSGGGSIPIGIYKSINAGVNWTAANTGISNVAVNHIAVSALDANILYASAGGAVYRSANAGGTWANVTSNLPLFSSGGIGRLVIDPANDAVVFAATPAGVFVTANAGGAWTARRGGWPTVNGVFHSVRALTMDPSAPTTLYASPASPSPGPIGFLGEAALGAGLMKSTDSGVTWVSAGAELAGVFVRHVAIDGTTVFAATNNGVFRLGAALPTVTVDKSALTFGAVTTGAAFVTKTSTQSVRISQSGSGTVTWTATSVSPWLVVSPASGSGSATLTVSVQFAAGLAAAQTGAITLTLTGAANSAGPVSVALNTVRAGGRRAAGFVRYTHRRLDRRDRLDRGDRLGDGRHRNHPRARVCGIRWLANPRGARVHRRRRPGRRGAARHRGSLSRRAATRRAPAGAT